MGLMGLEVESFGVLGAAAAAAAQSNDKMDTSCMSSMYSFCVWGATCALDAAAKSNDKMGTSCMSICSAMLNGEFV
jgi:hypothetical protein